MLQTGKKFLPEMPVRRRVWALKEVFCGSGWQEMSTGVRSCRPHHGRKWVLRDMGKTRIVGEALTARSWWCLRSGQWVGSFLLVAYEVVGIRREGEEAEHVPNIPISLAVAPAACRVCSHACHAKRNKVMGPCCDVRYYKPYGMRCGGGCRKGGAWCNTSTGKQGWWREVALVVHIIS
jgi:hypothetical protein